jgi:methylenetetrahydrofolate reductase (NADPH)
VTGAVDSCPKHMVFGPCGGVRADLSCEMEPHPCPFATRAVVEWTDSVSWSPHPQTVSAPGSELLARLQHRAVVITDLTLPPFDADGLEAITSVLADTCDALLVGEHQNRPDFPPTLMAAMIKRAGGRPIITLTCRDRNRLVLEQDLAGLSLVGVDGVLCVTGDGRAQGVRPGVTQVFDLDGPRLAGLAASIGLPVLVPESPNAAPTALRPARLLQKQRAGADAAILNHVADLDDLARFVSAARTAGVTIPLIAGVAVYTDSRSAAVMQNFPGLHVDPAQIRRVLDSADPVSAGIEQATEEARQLLAIDGVRGVNLSGLASGDGELAAAGIKAEIGRRVQAWT